MAERLVWSPSLSDSLQYLKDIIFAFCWLEATHRFSKWLIVTLIFIFLSFDQMLNQQPSVLDVQRMERSQHLNN